MFLSIPRAPRGSAVNIFVRLDDTQDMQGYVKPLLDSKCSLTTSPNEMIRLDSTIKYTFRDSDGKNEPEQLCKWIL